MTLPARNLPNVYPSSHERYDTGIITGSLLWSDTKVVVDLLLEQKSPPEIREAVSVHNPLLRRTKNRSLKITSYLLNRYNRCPIGLLELIANPDSNTSKQAAFLASLLFSRFLRDFMNEVVCETLDGTPNHLLQPEFWRDFWSSCVSKEPELHELREKAVVEIRATLLRFLSEVGVLEGIRSRELQRITLTPHIQSVLGTPELSTLRFYLRSFVR
jgi:hypothetical protein